MAEMEEKIRNMEASTYDGVFVWKITEFARKRQEAITGRSPAIFSPGGQNPHYHEDRMVATEFGKGQNLEFKTANCTRKVHSGPNLGQARVQPISLGGKGDGLAGFLLCSFPGPGRAGCPVVWSVSLATPTILEPSFLLFLYGFYIHKVRGVLRRPREAVGMFSLD